MAKEHGSPAHSESSEDLKKPGVPSRPRPLRAVSKAAATLVSGSTGSLAKALQVFSEDLEKENVSRVGFTNAWITGVLEAYASFFEQMAKTSRRLFEEVRDTADTGAGGGGAIDYERLARLVAGELRKHDEKIA
jgi:hypothetical protein